MYLRNEENRGDAFGNHQPPTSTISVPIPHYKHSDLTLQQALRRTSYGSDLIRQTETTGLTLKDL